MRGQYECKPQYENYDSLEFASRKPSNLGHVNNDSWLSLNSIHNGLISVICGAAAYSTIRQAPGTRRAFSDLAGAEFARRGFLTPGRRRMRDHGSCDRGEPRFERLQRVLVLLTSMAAVSDPRLTRPD